ncbi:Flagellar biosynthesis protein FlhF [hydrothermal vent metagenome]|uniref:Flagellar biosynthesis protein FlhF n=1 Tax=hydrothermal vent metagenome TaxID=652676 RepID=A0A3B0WA55_9ZZZZ
MKMKRYFAADSRQALRELREDQGPDAVILSNRRVQGGVEIIAALDYEDAMVNSSLGNPDSLPPPTDNTKQAGYSEPQVNENSYGHSQFTESSYSSVTDDKEHETKEDASTLNKIQDELKGLRNIIEAPLMQFAWGESGRVQPLYANLLKQLMSLGLSSKLSQSIAKRTAKQGLTKHSWLESLKLLAKLVPINDEDILENGGIVSLIGPTGVGKTTTIAKLAARFALKHGRRGVTLITTDNYRIGAHEQLRTYGRILGVPVHIATDAAELKCLLKEVREKSEDCEHQLILIDTAGVCQKDVRLGEQLMTLNLRGMDIKNYLVLSATGQMNLQDEVIRSFKKLKLSGCMLTKIDEAASLGEVMSVLIQHDLPLHFVCDGQKVPDDLHQARGQLLVKEAVKLMRLTNKPPSSEELAYSFDGMVTNAII